MNLHACNVRWGPPSCSSNAGPGNLVFFMSTPQPLSESYDKHVIASKEDRDDKD